MNTQSTIHEPGGQVLNNIPGHSIINKILSAAIDNDSRITETDRLVCQKCEANYHDYLKRLDELHAVFTQVLDTHFKDRYRVTTNHRGETEYERTDKYDYSTRELEFFPGPALKKIAEKKESLQTWFCSTIVGHFNDTYGLELNTSHDTTGVLEKATSYKPVLDWIILQLGGMSFTEKARNNVTCNFRSLLESTGLSLKITKNKLAIVNGDYSLHYKLFYCTYGGTYQFENKEPFMQFQRALGYFETGHTDHIPGSAMTIGEEVKYNHNYEYYHTKKLLAVRFYKKGKTEITFSSAEEAQAFVRCFDLDSLSGDPD